MQCRQIVGKTWGNKTIYDKMDIRSYDTSNHVVCSGAWDQTWARGQLNYDGFLVLWSPKQTEKMLQFGPKNDVISKKKVFTEIVTVLSVGFRWSPKKKRSLGFTCWCLSVISMGPLKPTAPRWASLKPMGSGVIVPPAPLSAALVVCVCVLGWRSQQKVSS